METTTFVRRPFTVQAVEVTVDNIAEIAELIGSLKKRDNGQPYIQVDKKKVPNVFQVRPGFFVTFMNENIRCYSRKVFNEQFVKGAPEIMTWVEYLGHKIQQAEPVKKEVLLGGPIVQGDGTGLDEVVPVVEI